MSTITMTQPGGDSWTQQHQPNTISDPTIRHGEPTFRGTRIRVADVLEQVESGMAYEAIIEAALRV